LISSVLLGFLNANDSPRAQVSNYGLMDQMAALQWVRENGEAFGGDVNRVTVLGHGSGAACVEFLAHSPTMVPGEQNADERASHPVRPSGRVQFCLWKGRKSDSRVEYPFNNVIS